MTDDGETPKTSTLVEDVLTVQYGDEVGECWDVSLPAGTLDKLESQANKLGIGLSEYIVEHVLTPYLNEDH